MTAREWSIIMSAESIRGILAGRKTQTRRLVGRRVPYGVGGRLWVKEAWKSSTYSCEEDPEPLDHVHTKHCNQTYVYYAASPRVGYRPVPDRERITYLDESSPLTEWYASGWKSPLFMPRWASRLLLEVTSIREERLHELTEEDAIAEGIERHETLHDVHWLHGGRRFASAQTAYSCAWDDLHGKRAPWVSNPVVRVIGFRRVEGACAG